MQWDLPVCMLCMYLLHNAQLHMCVFNTVISMSYLMNCVLDAVIAQLQYSVGMHFPVNLYRETHELQSFIECIVI